MSHTRRSLPGVRVVLAIAALALPASARPGYDDGQHANEQAFCALTEAGCLSCFGTASYGGEVPGDAHMVAATTAEGFEDLRHEVETVSYTHLTLPTKA